MSAARGGQDGVVMLTVSSSVVRAGEGIEWALLGCSSSSPAVLNPLADKPSGTKMAVGDIDTIRIRDYA